MLPGIVCSRKSRFCRTNRCFKRPFPTKIRAQELQDAGKHCPAASCGVAEQTNIRIKANDRVINFSAPPLLPPTPPPSLFSKTNSDCSEHLYQVLLYVLPRNYWCDCGSWNDCTLEEIARVNITHQQSPSLIHPHPLRQRNTVGHRFVIKEGAGQMGDRIAPSLHESWWPTALVSPIWIVLGGFKPHKLLVADVFFFVGLFLKDVLDIITCTCFSLI